MTQINDKRLEINCFQILNDSIIRVQLTTSPPTRILVSLLTKQIVRQYRPKMVSPNIF